MVSPIAFAGGVKMAEDQEGAMVVRTLLAVGYQVKRVSREPNYLAITATKVGRFGALEKSLIAYAGDGRVSKADCENLKRLALANGDFAILVSAEPGPPGLAHFTKAGFLDHLGGPIASSIVLEDEYADRLSVLAANRLPENLDGRPDELFESYVWAGLGFLFQGRVQRYGQERRFEAVSDGVVRAGTTPWMLYDCKAAGQGYKLTQTSVRQFADYVRKFHERYEARVGRLHCFLVFSSRFQSLQVLHERSNELYAECGIGMVCVTAECFGKIVDLFVSNVEYRKTVDWRQVLVPPMVTYEQVEKNLAGRQRDSVIERS
jgi:hypothetical protein